jgi:hypothetical protein
LQKGAAIAGIVGAVVATVQLLRGNTPFNQQSGDGNVQGNVSAAAGSVAVGHGATLNVLAGNPDNPASTRGEPTLYVECHLSGLPAWGTGQPIYQLQLWPLPASNGGGGLMEQIAPTGAEIKWPTDGLPRIIQRCEITNDGGYTLTHVQTDLQLQFKEALVDEAQAGVMRSGEITVSRPWMIYVARIDPGRDHAFSFYVWNMSQQFAQVGLPDSAMAQALGDKQARAIQVIHPLNSFMMFSPFIEPKQGTPATSPLP